MRPIKLRRRDLADPSQYLTYTERAGAFIKEHARIIGLSALGVLVLTAALVVTEQYRARARRIVAEQFYEAFSALQKNQLPSAEASFRKLFTSRIDSRIRQLSGFYLATCYIKEGRLALARQTLVETVPMLTEERFKGMALTELGSLYEQEHDLKHALEAYREASELSSPEKLRAELAAARILAELGNKNEAVEALNRFLERHPYASEREEALEQLALLGVRPQGRQTASSAPKPANPANKTESSTR